MNQAIFHALDVPLIGAGVLGRKLVEDAGENAADIIFKDQLALLAAPGCNKPPAPLQREQEPLSA